MLFFELPPEPPAIVQNYRGPIIPERLYLELATNCPHLPTDQQVIISEAVARRAQQGDGVIIIDVATVTPRHLQQHMNAVTSSLINSSRTFAISCSDDGTRLAEGMRILADEVDEGSPFGYGHSIGHENFWIPGQGNVHLYYLFPMSEIPF